jgi:beta-lactamase class D
MDDLGGIGIKHLCADVKPVVVIEKVHDRALADRFSNPRGLLHELGEGFSERPRGLIEPAIDLNPLMDANGRRLGARGIVQISLDPDGRGRLRSGGCRGAEKETHEKKSRSPPSEREEREGRGAPGFRHESDLQRVRERISGTLPGADVRGEDRGRMRRSPEFERFEVCAPSLLSGKPPLMISNAPWSGRVWLGFGLLLLPAGVLAQSSPSAGISEHPALQACVDESGFEATVLVRALGGGSWVGGAGVDRAELPASTFKIVSAMVSLEEGVVEGPETVLLWDQVPNPRPEIHRDLALREAFRLSAVPHFQALVRALGPTRMQTWLERLGYGNQRIEGTFDRFWLDGGLRITPRAQVDFLERLIRADLPISAPTRDALLDIMEFERIPGADGQPDVVLRAKTGYALPPGDGAIGWWVGWVERGSEAQLFATLLTAPEEVPGLLEARMSIARCALAALGALDPVRGG